MGRISEFVRGLFGITFGIPGAETWEAAYRFKTGQDLSGGGGSGGLNEPYRQHPIIAKAVGQIARDAASVPWEMFRRTSSGKIGSNPDLRHPVLEIWSRPNPLMNGRQFWIGSYLSKLLFGEFFWYYPNLQITRPTPGSNPRIEALLEGPTRIVGDAQIILLDPRCVVIKPDGNGIRYYLKRGGVEEPIDGSDLEFLGLD